MTIPVLTVPYPVVNDNIDDPVNFDVSQGWDDADFFEVNTLPPDFTFDGVITIGGVASTKIVYTIYIRAGNADGLSDWEPLQWNTTGGTSQRTLYGLSTDWQLVNPITQAGVIYIKTATKTGRQSTWNAGVMLINDTDDDGSAAKYDSSFIDSQIVLDGASDTYLRSTEVGWEVIIDTAVV